MKGYLKNRRSPRCVGEIQRAVVQMPNWVSWATRQRTDELFAYLTVGCRSGYIGGDACFS
jgi:hypothetical protein